MTDCVGIDVAATADQNHLQTATTLLGQAPAFWGRYFKGPGNLMPVQYQADREADFLANQGIPIVPVARQTPDVAVADQNFGYAAGLRNAAALIASFGAAYLSQLTNGIAVFLDVEMNTPLTHQYFIGWSSGLIDGGAKSLIDFRDEVAAGKLPKGASINFIPCIYGHHAADKTWQELQLAITGGAKCGAAWVVYEDANPTFPIGPWNANYTNRYMPAQVPVVLCQRILDYNNNGGFDFDLVNPAHQAWLLQRLVLPNCAAAVA